MTSAWRLAASVCVILNFASTSSWARDFYYTSTAVSNITFEGSPQGGTIDGMGCNWAANTYTCLLPALKCRVIVANVNPAATPPSQNVTITMNYTLMYQNNTASVTANPFQNSIGTDLSFTSLLSGVVSGWKGTIGTFAALTAASGTVTLAQNQYYMSERYIQPSYTIATDAAKNITAGTGYSQWPHGKWFASCSGKITVADTVAASPGFVVAHGSQDYYNSSYQNQPIDYGGFNTFGTNTLNSKTKISTITAKSSGTAGCNPGGTTATVYSYGFAKATAEDSADCTVGVTTNNAQKPSLVGNASTNWPIQISQVPIVINGGAPL